MVLLLSCKITFTEFLFAAFVTYSNNLSGWFVLRQLIINAIV